MLPQEWATLIRFSLLVSPATDLSTAPDANACSCQCGWLRKRLAGQSGQGALDGTDKGARPLWENPVRSGTRLIRSYG